MEVRRSKLALDSGFLNKRMDGYMNEQMKGLGGGMKG